MGIEVDLNASWRHLVYWDALFKNVFFATSKQGNDGEHR